jgi:four helix bundle protein
MEVVPRKFDLEDRLVNYSSTIMKLVEGLPTSKGGGHIGNQMVRSGVAPALLYGEAQGAESRDDFVLKMKIALKELKETRVCLKLVVKNGMVKNVDAIIKENEELISIFSKSVVTATNNKKSEN